MKRFLSVFLIIFLLFGICSIVASGDFITGGLTYKTQGTNATITAYASSGSVSIPATVRYNSTTYRVTQIGANAFINKNITSVDFSAAANLQSIGSCAFSTNPNLTSITIPASVRSIGNRAFNSCVALERLEFQEGSELTTIGKWAFKNCHALSDFTLPTELTSIEEAAFSYCTSINSVSIPASVTNIGDEAFLGCINLRKAIIQNAQAQIGSAAFDLTYSNSNGRRLVIWGINNSTAKTFAQRESFSFSIFTPPPAPTEDVVVVPPEAGSYDIKVTVVVRGTETFNNRYQGFEVHGDDDANDSAGVTVRCYNNNGTSTSSYEDLDWDLGKQGENQIGKKGTYYLSATSTGFPKYLYAYLDDNYFLGGGKFAVTKLEVKGTNQQNYTELWSGDFQMASGYNGYGGWLRYDGYFKAFENKIKNADENPSSGKDDGNNNYINGKAGWSANLPKATSISDLSDGVEEASVNTDGTTYTVPTAFTYGNILDQYTVTMPYNPTLSAVNAADNSIMAGVSVNNFRKLVLTDEANRAEDYSIKIVEKYDDNANNIHISNDNCTVEVNTFDYNITFSYFDGTMSCSTEPQTVDYGQAAVAPDVTPYKFDNIGHRIFNSWSQNLTITSGKQDQQISAEYGQRANHSITDETEIVAPSCNEQGYTKHFCSVCSFEYKDTYQPAYHHDNWNPESENVFEFNISPGDGHAGYTAFQCTRCISAFVLAHDDGEGNLVADTDEGVFESVENMQQAVDTSGAASVIPSPAFNNFSVTYSQNQVYDYKMRGASLRIDYQNTFNANDGQNGYTNTQDLRFSGALTVPEGVSYQVGTQADNVVTDFGFVYTQYRFITGSNTLVIGGRTDNTSIDGKTYPISQMSVVNKNAARGNYTGSNWKGVTARTVNGKTQLTFNLVIAIKAKNWNYLYCARPYIKYLYNGTEYTVYDQGTTILSGGNRFSCNSVAYVATQVVADNSVHIIERNYFQNKVIDHLSALPGYEG